MALIEDSAHAIFTIVATSAATVGKLPKGYASHFRPWYSARVLCMFRPNSTDPLIQSKRLRKTINPFALEFFAQGILRRLGIRSAEQAICNATQARALPHNFVVKIAGNSNGLKWNPNGQTWNPAVVRGGWCLVSELVPNAASLDYVSRKLVTSQSVRTQMLRESAAIHAQKDQITEKLIAQALGKTCEPADTFFTDFQPSESEIELIKHAMALDGMPYIRVCAARVFIGCSAPHFGNVLVTKKGELISIDHTRGYFEKGDDLRELFYFINRRSEAFKVLAGVSDLTEKDICESVAEIPRHIACGSTAGFADYYCERLNLWKEFHAKSDRSLLMEMDPRLTCWNTLGSFGERLIEETAALYRPTVTR
jgi:hypothetical protein